MQRSVDVARVSFLGIEANGADGCRVAGGTRPPPRRARSCVRVDDVACGEGRSSGDRQRTGARSRASCDAARRAARAARAAPRRERATHRRGAEAPPRRAGAAPRRSPRRPRDRSCRRRRSTPRARARPPARADPRRDRTRRGARGRHHLAATWRALSALSRRLAEPHRDELHERAARAIDVVEDDHDLAAALERAGDARRAAARGGGRARGDAQRAGELAARAVGVGLARERADHRGELRRERALADARRAGQRDEPMPGDRTHEVRELGVAPQEGRAPRGPLRTTHLNRR